MKYYSVYVKGVKSFFTYKSSQDLKEGEWVIVSFRKKDSLGLIIKEEIVQNYEFNVLDVKSKVNFLNISKELLELMLWISEYYLCEFNDILTLLYPNTLSLDSKERIVLGDFEPRNEEEELLKKYMKKKGSVTLNTLKKNFNPLLINKLLDKKSLLTTKIIDAKELLTDNLDVKRYVNEKEVTLTEKQKEIKDEIIRSSEKFHLINGVTGSGKTEIYISLIKEALLNDQGAIFLLPEISLTTQFIKRFKDEFKDHISILHSKQKPKEKEEEWLSIYKGEKKVVLGVRSAIFAPIKNLKYIIIDEEHETSYKQENSPRYDTRQVATKRALLANAKLVLGSATPSIESSYYAETKIFKAYYLENRFMNYAMPNITILDMRAEPKKILSNELIKAVNRRLEKKEQVLIITRRKGFASSVQCLECGLVEKCKRCSISLTYYRFGNSLKCNYCDYEKAFVKKCTTCNSFSLRLLGQGTEKVFEKIGEHFPNARIVRVDSEIAKNRDNYEKIYEDFLNNKYDIMVGTKLIAKGFHFPNVTLVGVIDMDSLLYFPDFRASERTFQLLVQASGRSGRSEKSGEVIIQSYLPDHYVIQHSKRGNYFSFYEEELLNRKDLSYPPYCKLINIIVSSTDEEKAAQEAQKISNMLKKFSNIYGPLKAPIYIINKRFRYHIFIKSKREDIFKIKDLIKNLILPLNRGQIRVAVDIEPINLL